MAAETIDDLCVTRVGDEVIIVDVRETGTVLARLGDGDAQLLAQRITSAADPPA